MEESDKFYKALQEVIDMFRNTSQLVIGGDFNAKVGNRPISQYIATFGEDIMNST